MGKIDYLIVFLKYFKFYIMDISLFAVISFIFGAYFPYFTDILFLFLSIFDYNIYKITHNNLNRLKKKNIKFASIWYNSNPSGLVIYKNHIGYIKNESINMGSTEVLYLFCHKNTYNKLIYNDDDYIDISIIDDNNNKSIEKKINYRERQGNYNWLDYQERKLNTTNKIPTFDQKEIINNLINIFSKKEKCVSLITGNPGTGKSMVPQFLCKKLLKNYESVTFCDSLNLCDPGDSFSYLYNIVLPDKNAPFILVIEEVDILIHNIHYELIKKHKISPIQLVNKNDWNTLFDKIDRLVYRNIFVIMTSNKPKQWFDNLDSSYMRKGRVDYHFNIKQKII